jgi:hypothetical protein
MARGGLQKATVLGWTGRGTLVDLESSIGGVLESAGIKGKMVTSGRSLVIEGPDPSIVGSAVRNAPGVDWVAVGMALRTFREVGETAKVLAKRYIRPGARFSVVPSGGRGVHGSDVGGAVVSAVLEEVRMAKVDEARPEVVLRASMAKTGGAIGVEVSRGPGGVPTGRTGVACLVSGGMHSSVLCWMALLAGYRLTMVHARISEESTMAVARLYAELSRRADPRGIVLDVLVGKDAGRTVNWARQNEKQPVFVGTHSGCSDLWRATAGTMAPLYLAQEEWFRSEISKLSLKPHLEQLASSNGSTPPDETLSFGGARADVSGVLDGLRVRTTPVR